MSRDTKSHDRNVMVAEVCLNKANHTPQPTAYLEWVAWAETMIDTHEQVKCADCGRYMIWVPKNQPPHDDLGEPQTLDYR